MGTSAVWSHQTVLAAVAVSASAARDFVRGHLVDHNLAHLVGDVELVASELATNALVHARTAFTVILEAFEGVVLLQVLDGSQAGPELVAARSLDTGGRGVAIVESLSGNWGVSTRAHGKSVWAEFATVLTDPATRVPARSQFEVLLEAITTARARLDATRAAPGGHRSARGDAQRDMLAALERYASALNEAGRPLPYRLRDELRLYRGLDLST